jgi:hypothetical protein
MNKQIKTIKGQDGLFWWTVAAVPSVSSWKGVEPRHAQGFETEEAALEAARLSLEDDD